MEQVKNIATVARLEMPKGGYENLKVLRSILFEFIEGTIGNDCIQV
jgi:hypothetical protein